MKSKIKFLCGVVTLLASLFTLPNADAGTYDQSDIAGGVVTTMVVSNAPIGLAATTYSNRPSQVFYVPRDRVLTLFMSNSIAATTVGNVTLAVSSAPDGTNFTPWALSYPWSFTVTNGNVVGSLQPTNFNYGPYIRIAGYTNTSAVVVGISNLVLGVRY